MRTQQQLTILGGLAVVMIAVYAKAFKPAGASAPAPEVDASSMNEPHEAVPPVSSVSAAEPSKQRDAQRSRAAALSWSRDPFTRGAALGQVSGLSLSGILWDAAAPLAIINGQPVRAGEAFESYTIVSISHDSVTVSDGTQTFQLTISP